MIFHQINIILNFFFPALKFKYASYILFFISTALTIFGTIYYPGASKFTYILFSFLSFSMLFNLFSNTQSYFLLYSGSLLWLGLWWKATGFFTGIIRLVESTGNFNYTTQAYDQSMIVCTVGMLATLSAVKFFNYFKLSSLLAEPVLKTGPLLLPKLNFTYCWLFFYLIILTFSALNFSLGLQQAGLPPRTILPFPLNAVIYFMLSAGFGIITSMLIFYQLRFDKKVSISNMMISMSIVTLLCISTLSRANIIFYPISMIVAYFFNQSIFSIFSNYKKAKLLLILSLLYAFSFSSISLLRDYYYIPASNAAPDAIAIMKQNGVKHEGNKVIIAFKRLLLSRWIGYEGVMTSVGNQSNSLTLLLELVSQKPETSLPDKYLTISRSGLALTTSDKFTPTTLPGPIGFAYLSGSLAMVLALVFITILIFALIEYSLFKVFKNPFLCSFYGMISAVIFIHIGLAPINIVKFYILFGVTLLGIYLAKKIIALKSFERFFQYQA